MQMKTIPIRNMQMRTILFLNIVIRRTNYTCTLLLYAMSSNNRNVCLSEIIQSSKPTMHWHQLEN